MEFELNLCPRPLSACRAVLLSSFPAVSMDERLVLENDAPAISTGFEPYDQPWRIASLTSTGTHPRRQTGGTTHLSFIRVKVPLFHLYMHVPFFCTICTRGHAINHGEPPGANYSGEATGRGGKSYPVPLTLLANNFGMTSLLPFVTHKKVAHLSIPEP